MIGLCDLINEARILRRRGLSYAEIAKRLEAKGVKVSRVTVMRWCKGLHNPLNRMNAVRLDPSPELAYVIGVIFGDGSVSFKRKGYKYRIRLKVIDREFAEEFKRCLEALGLKPSIRLERDRTRCDRWCVEANSKILYEFLRQPKEKLFEVVRKHSVEFLRGFFDSEGTVGLCEKYRSLYIGAANYDIEVLKFARNLLKQLRIHSKIYKMKRKGDLSKIRGKIYRYKSDLFILVIRRRADVKRFIETVGFSIQRKMTKAKKALEVLKYSSNIMRSSQNNLKE